jgi:phosphonate transport system ATP-binding protein
VTVRYAGAAALADLDLEIGPGEGVAIVGPSGSGKTTLLRLLNASVRPTAGRVEVDGRAVSDLSPRALKQVRAQIGLVPQDLGLVPNIRVSQNVLSGRVGKLSLLASLSSVILPRRADLLLVHEILNRVGIPEKLFERTDRLSGGQQQRVAIARTLMQDPRAILADEPVASVDPARARDTVKLLTGICADRGITLIMSLHNLDLAREFFPRLVGLRRGRRVFDAPADDLSAEEFEELYHLKPEELLADGA